MSWALPYIQKLLNKEEISFRPRGNSMQPLINSGDLVTVSPDISDLSVGSVVLCKVSGKHYLHLIKAIDKDRYQIGNNRGGINGWVGLNSIYGKAIRVEG